MVPSDLAKKDGVRAIKFRHPEKGPSPGKAITVV